MMAGAILTQNTSWRNVEQALKKLKEVRALEPGVLKTMPADELALLIRPAGYYNVKARRLKALVSMLFEEYDGRIEALLAVPEPALREKLLGVNGIGPETADTILLYAAGYPAFVIDAYTLRLLRRHGWIGEKATYDEAAALFKAGLPLDVRLFNEFHALIVRVGKEHCRSGAPRCGECPLKGLLRQGQPL